MTKILVSGLINIETTLQVNAFPVDYSPVNYPFYGINSSVSGVGYNIAKALTALGDEVVFLSIIGDDLASRIVHSTLAEDHLDGRYVLDIASNTAQSVILYDSNGRRQIHVDLKNIQDLSYPEAIFEEVLPGCEMAILCNINFSRAMLQKIKKAGKPVATDVHAISNLEDEYNCDFMRAADILFMSDELLPIKPEDWTKQVLKKFAPEILVIGLGSQGVLLSVRRDHFIERVRAIQTRSIVSTIGAGDALFSAFVHGYIHSGDPYTAIRKAILFASYKIGAASASDGFLDDNELEDLYLKFTKQEESK